MKRFLILISCILLIVSLSVTALAAPVSWSDYVVTVIPGIDNDINSVFIPPSKVPVQWRYNGATTVASSFSFTVSQVSNVGISTSLFSSLYPLGIEGIEGQDTLEVFFRFSDSRLPNLTNVIYYWNDGTKNIKTVWTGFKQTGWDYSFTVDLTQKPEGATALVFALETAGELSAGDYTIEFLGISFDVLSAGTLTPSDPMIIEPVDYLVTESSNGTTSSLYVSVPSEDITMQWHLLRDDDYSIIKQSYGNPFPVTLDRLEYDYWIDCMVYDKLDITDIVDGSTMSVDFDILPELGQHEPLVGSVRYQVRYFDYAGNLLDNVNFFVVPDANWFDETKLDLVIDKPAGAVSMSFYLQFIDIYSEQLSCDFTLELKSVNFICDIPTMVRLQQETGRTNKLLEEIKDGWTPDPDVPPFKDDVDQVIDKENEIVDSLNPDQTIGDLEDIQLTIFDNLLLYAGGFLAIQRIFDIFIDIPWLKMVIYVSLALGLLGAFLNIGAMANRADRSSKSRKGD